MSSISFSRPAIISVWSMFSQVRRFNSLRAILRAYSASRVCPTSAFTSFRNLVLLPAAASMASAPNFSALIAVSAVSIPGMNIPCSLPYVVQLFFAFPCKQNLGNYSSLKSWLRE